MNGRRMKVVVAEDEALSLKRLVRLLQEAGCEVLNSFSEGRGALEWLAQHREEVDAIFLDIHMPNLDGLTILRALGGQVPMVLTTAFSEHAVDAFDSEAVDYLLKPVTASRLERALRRIEQRRGTPASQPVPAGPLRYPVQAGAGVVFVDLSKTTYFEVESEVVWAHAGGRLRTQWKSLGEVEAALPGANLLRIHRHLLVRLEAVLGLRPAPGGRAMVRLSGGEEIEASRGGAPRLREHFGIS